jgi:hypothetical protein
LIVLRIAGGSPEYRRKERQLRTDAEPSKAFVAFSAPPECPAKYRANGGCDAEHRRKRRKQCFAVDAGTRPKTEGPRLVVCAASVQQVDMARL